MSQPLNLLERIQKEYPQMSKGQKRIADFILENYDKAAFATAAKMGREIDVSESTVVRFAYAMGYSGYPELQHSLQELIRNKLTSVQRINLLSDFNKADSLQSVFKTDILNIRKTADALDTEVFYRVIQDLISAKTVYILGLRSALPLAQILYYYLNFVLNDVRVLATMANDAFEEMINISEQDIFIGISFPRYSQRTLDAMRFAKDSGAHTVAITDSMTSPLVEMAHSPLIARSDMASFADSLVAPLSLINALIVELSRNNTQFVVQKFQQLEKLWDSQGVYIREEEVGSMKEENSEIEQTIEKGEE